MLIAAIALTALAYVPGDGIKSVRWDLRVPVTLDMRLVDEGVDIAVCLQGPLAIAAYAEARRLVLDLADPPGSLTPIQECAREAKISCGAAGVQSVTVSNGPGGVQLCSWTCFPQTPSTHPPATNPPVVPPTAPGAGA